MSRKSRKILKTFLFTQNKASFIYVHQLFFSMQMENWLFGLIVALIFGLTLLVAWAAYKLGKAREKLKFEQSIQRLRREIAEKQRAGIKGKVSEIFAPYLKDFPFKPSECKFIGDPIDYVVFEGLDERNVNKIILVEIKSGSSRLSKHQKQIEGLIRKKNVEFYLYRFGTNENNI